MITDLNSMMMFKNASSGGGGGVDSNTVLLVHADGVTNGTLVDSSSYNTPITTRGTNNGGIVTTLSKFGNGSLFYNTNNPGNNPRNTIGTSAGFNPTNFFQAGFPITFDFWIYSLSNDYVIISNLYDKGVDLGVNPSGNPTFGSASGGTSRTFTDLTVPTNTWTHVEYASTGSVITCFVNGVKSTLTGAPTNQSSPYGLQLAWRATVENGRLSGYLDEIRISNIVRHTSNFTPPTTPY